MTTIYLDMDGVVADFNAYAGAILNTSKISHTWPDEDWNKIKENPRLYRDLDKTQEADNLVETCRKICKEQNWNLLFLTAIPKKNDLPYAYYDKVIWATKHYPDIPVHFGPLSTDKWKHCIKGDILIDDRPSNCVQWREAGGHSILHEGDLHSTLKSLQSFI